MKTLVTLTLLVPLAGLALADTVGRADAAAVAAVLDAVGEPVGRVTRCAHSPRLDRNIGWANVPVALADIGTAANMGATRASSSSSDSVPSTTRRMALAE